tara:strand:+ start:5927 stop:6925 length:999 start_codon:yes stop_codon:yes gene_type:complete
MKTAIIIGYGGMGKRYHLALKKCNIKVLQIYDPKIKNKFVDKVPIYGNLKDYKKLSADLVCVAANTKNRFEITKNILKKSNIKKIITEKPLSVSYEKCLFLKKLIDKTDKRLLVNTHRSYSKNFLMIKNFFKNKDEKISHIFINSPAAGIGNMGSTFFDIVQFFIEKKPDTIYANLDKSKTPNPRGKIFKDPGAFGIINYKDQAKVFFDLSEDTGLPYKIVFKSKNFELKFDEINNQLFVEERPKKLRIKPLYYYLFKPKTYKIKLAHKFDVVNMTAVCIKKIFSKKFDKSNFNRNLIVSEIISAVFASSYQKKLIKFPLNKKYHKIECNFA